MFYLNLKLLNPAFSLYLCQAIYMQLIANYSYSQIFITGVSVLTGYDSEEFATNLHAASVFT